MPVNHVRWDTTARWELLHLPKKCVPLVIIVLKELIYTPKILVQLVHTTAWKDKYQLVLVKYALLERIVQLVVVFLPLAHQVTTVLQALGTHVNILAQLEHILVRQRGY
jgi:hypothetical protein